MSLLCAVVAGSFLGAHLSFAQVAADPGEQMVTIAGVPIYNYQRHVTVRSQDLRRNADPVDWILMLHDNATGAEVHELCGGGVAEDACVGKGHPSDGGVAFVKIRATKAKLEELLHKHSGKVAFGEADGDLLLSPDIPGSWLSQGLLPQNLSSNLPWGLDRVDAREGLDGSFSGPPDGGAGVHVYIVDTGILTAHSDFGGRARATLEVLGDEPRVCSMLDDSECAQDPNGHGTHVAGIIGGTHFGVAKGVTLHAVRTILRDGTGKISWLVQALDWIAVHGQRPAIVSASLRDHGTSPTLTKAVSTVVQAGVTMIVAAGNDASDACDFTPAGIPAVITVGATTSDDFMAPYSNFGACVDIFAPGTDIVSDNNAGIDSLTKKSGTSMACPHVSGAAALLLQAHGDLKPAEVARRLGERATRGVLCGLTSDSPNRLVYVGPGDAPQPLPRQCAAARGLQRGRGL